MNEYCCYDTGDKLLLDLATSDQELTRYALNLSSALKSLGLSKRPVEPNGPDGVAFPGSAGSSKDTLHPANLERQAIGVNLHGLGVIDLHDPAQSKRNEATIDSYAKAMRHHFLSTLKEGGSGDPLTQDYLNRLKATAGQVRTAQTLASHIAPFTRWFATSHFKDLPAGTSARAESTASTPVESTSSGEDETVLEQPEPEYLNDPIGWASQKRLLTDEQALPILQEAKKSREMLNRAKRERLDSYTRAFGALRALQSSGVPEHIWLEKLTDKKAGPGMRKQSALSAIKKFHKLTSDQKAKLDPLKFAAALNEVLKGRIARNTSSS